MMVDDSRRVVAAWAEEECPQGCGEAGRVLWMVHCDGGLTSRCLGCRRDSYLTENFDWVYTDIGYEYGEAWAIAARW